ncbi:hypothetical protein RJ641_023889 [Dillenia turbinata]|uniref:Uncharacterized protein n=1 Tax=Dillenia turbinata TaxID=194707 RepID=A0AAN8UHF0_9MAGN
MATRCPQVIILCSVSSSSSSSSVAAAARHRSPKILMHQQQPQLPPKKQQLSLQISSSSRTKVFEDRSSGIICYTDEKGEIVCEGYDEGPRFHQKILPTSYNPNSKEVEIIALLQKNWYRLVQGIEFENGRKVLAPEGFDLKLNLNGFTTFF